MAPGSVVGSASGSEIRCQPGWRGSAAAAGALLVERAKSVPMVVARVRLCSAMARVSRPLGTAGGMSRVVSAVPVAVVLVFDFVCVVIALLVRGAADAGAAKSGALCSKSAVVTMSATSCWTSDRRLWLWYITALLKVGFFGSINEQGEYMGRAIRARR